MVLRGGSWNNDNPTNFRCANRNNNNPDNRNNNNGFRCVRGPAITCAAVGVQSPTCRLERAAAGPGSPPAAPRSAGPEHAEARREPVRFIPHRSRPALFLRGCHRCL